MLLVKSGPHLAFEFTFELATQLHLVPASADSTSSYLAQ
uniref:Uncharacterized protein n=2 Tax=Picea TaxID=3328 RepID=A0A101LV69_PICGL|nr:hypothetical protein ABT39_MTgene2062 [Picea glauca]QHR92745.1 hypothetical protein Q903MT_gene6793 [Picea sitchensis]